MRALLQRKRPHTCPRSKPFPQERLILALIFTMLLVSAGVLLILSTVNIIPGFWSAIFTPILTIAGLIIGVFAWLFPRTSVDGTPPTTPTSKPDSPHWIVPYPHIRFFIGREALLTHLYDTLQNKKAAALTGLGGIGKTQLAVEYAYLNRDKYHYVLWTTATTSETLATDFVALAERLVLPEKDSQDQTITVNAVKHWLETHSHWLLILDNADDLAITSNFLPTGGTGHVIITTRAQASRAVAQPLEVKELEPDDGAVFLLHRAGIVPLDASLADYSDKNQADARAIAHLLDGLPLAIDQAGAYIEKTRCTLSDYLARYQKQRATFLKERGRFPLVHPESVMTTFSLSFKKVQKANRAAADLLRFFAFLSPEAIPMDLLREGAPDLGKPLRDTAANPQTLDEALSTLYSYSLIRRDAATNTLYVHSLIQVVLKDQMSAGTQHQWAERTVRAVNRTFPSVKVETWQRCRQLLPQAIVCMTLIDQWHMSFPEAARLLNQAGSYSYVHAQYTEAEPLYQRALAIREKKLGADHPDTAQSLNNLAELYRSQGKYEQAEPLYQRALAIREKKLGADHPDMAQSLNDLALLYHSQGKYEQAEPLYQRALAIREKKLGADHPDMAQSLNNLAELYRSQSKYEQAELLYQRALAICEKKLGADHPDTTTVRENYTDLLQKTKDKQEQQS